MPALKRLHLILFSFIALSISSCATYYQKLLEFNDKIETGNIADAKALLEKDKKTPEGKNRLLYFMNRGTVEMLTGNYELSNQFFNQADITIEDYQKSFFSSPCFNL